MSMQRIQLKTAKALDRWDLERVPDYHTKYLLCVGKLIGSLSATKLQPHTSTQRLLQTLKMLLDSQFVLLDLKLLRKKHSKNS